MAEKTLITRRLFLRAIPPSLAVAGTVAAPLVVNAEVMASPEGENDAVLRVLHQRVMDIWELANIENETRGNSAILEACGSIATVMALIRADTTAGARRKREIAELTFDLGNGVRCIGSHIRLGASADQDFAHMEGLVA